MPRRLVPAILAAAALSACGRSDRSVQSAAQAPSRPEAVAVIPTPSKQTDAADFANRAAAGNAFELAAAQIAQSRASSNDVKAFAAMMLRDHTNSAQDFKAAIAASGQALSPSEALSPDQQQAMTDLKAAQPGDFDKTYMRTQVEAHQKALALFQEYAQNGTVTSLKSFAAQGAPVIQNHLEAAQQIMAALK